MDTVHIEFFVEPFSEGAPGRHVEAAVAAFRHRGLEPDVGPFATTAAGAIEPTADATAAMIRDALGSGATRISIHIQRGPEAHDRTEAGGT